MNKILRVIELARSEGIFFTVKLIYKKICLFLEQKSSLASIRKKYAVKENRKPCIYIDVSEISAVDWGTGIQRVTKCIFLAVLKNPQSKYDVVAVYGTEDSFGYKPARVIYSKNEDQISFDRKINSNKQIYFGPGDIFFGLDWSPHVVFFQRDYFDLLMRSGVKLYFLLHDLLPVRYPEFFPVGSKEKHLKWLYTISASHGVISVSASTQRVYMDWLNENNFKLKSDFNLGYSHNGSDFIRRDMYLASPKTRRHSNDAPKEILNFLMVGTLEPRKGHEQIIDAFELLWAQGSNIKLVIIGKIGWNVENLVKRIEQHIEFKERLIYKNNVSDTDLDEMYRNSSCLIAASFDEGFGLPLIEAAQYGVPVFARDIPVFREVAGDAAFYFKGADKLSVSKYLISWIELFKIGQVPVSSDMTWLSWDESASNMLHMLDKNM